MSNPNEVSNVESQENISDGISNSSSGSSGISSYLQTPHPEPQLSSNSHSDHDHPHSHDPPPQHHHHPVFINRRILCVDDVYCTSQVPKSSSRPKSSKLCSSTSRVLKGFLPSSFTRCPPSPWSLLTTLLPITGWLRTYRVREDLLADVITGVTILALHIPQGLAYGRLAGVEPINGLYVSLFPVVVYALFGGSRQISIGTFAVISIACRDVLDQVMATNMVDGEANLEPNQPVLVANLPTSISSFVSSFGGGGGGGDKQALAEPAAMAAVAEVTAIEVLTSLCLLVGIIQVSFWHSISLEHYQRLSILKQFFPSSLSSACFVWESLPRCSLSQSSLHSALPLPYTSSPVRCLPLSTSTRLNGLESRIFPLM